MGEPILRDGQWWYQTRRGEWLRWDAPSKQWRPTVLDPPPEPIPPPAPIEDDYSPGAQTTPLKTKPSREQKAAARAASREATKTEPLAVGSPPEEDPSFPMGPSDRQHNLVIAVGVGLLALLLIVFAAVKIFGGDEEPVATDQPQIGETAKEKYIAAADKLCVKARKVEQALPPPRSDRQLLEYANAVYEIRDTLGRRLQKLRPPRGDDRVLGRMSRAYGSSLRELAIAIESIRRGNERAQERAGQRASAFADKFNRMASEYGFEECNRIGEPT